MLKNYLLVTLRSFYKQKTYSLVNLTGLVLALAVGILAILYIRHELSYEKEIPNRENIYKVYRQWEKGRGNGYTPNPLAPLLPGTFPEIEHATQFLGGENVLVSHGEKSLYAQKIIITDSLFLKVIPFPLLQGDAVTALALPHSALITPKLAHNLFGEEDPMGKIIRFNDDFDLQVTGILGKPGNTHLKADIYLTDPGSFPATSWTGNNPMTYVSLNKASSIPALEGKMTQELNKYIKKDVESSGINYKKFPDWRLQPMHDIHLNTARVSGYPSGHGSVRNLYIIGIVAFVVLLIASINYMNLATAQATQRAREVGVRKVTGATQRQLIVQFLTEATLQTLIALPLAILLADLLLPAFEMMTGRDLTLNLQVWVSLSGYLLILILLFGLLSGSYPAFFLSAYRPADVLKGQWLRKDKGKMLRHGMVVTQFTSAMVAAIVMFFIYQQVQFMQNQELGFEAEQVLVVEINTQETMKNLETMKPKMLQHPGIQSIATTTALPGNSTSNYGFDIGGIEEMKSVDIIFTEPDFIETMGFEMAAGRFFSRDIASDSVGAYVVNEAFVRKYELKEPIGHPIRVTAAHDKPMGSIIGVVKDFHFNSLVHGIEPVVFQNTYRYVYRPYFVTIKINPQNIKSTINTIEQYWKQIEPAHPIRYSFLDQDFASLYAEQERLGKTLLYATMLTLLIAVLGLFGLASYMAEQRTKEIGVRKVLGASVWQIMVLLGTDFLKLVGIAGIIAIPLSIWLTHTWLSDFAYKTEITALPFAITILLAASVAIITVSSRTLRAALVNPVKSLRSE